MAKHFIITKPVAPPAESWDLDDDFEGTPPEGWDGSWGVSGPVGRSTVAPEGGTPAGGGTYVFEQSWPTGGSTPDWLRYNFSPALAEGDILTFEFWLKYKSGFDFNNTPHKLIIIRANNGALNQDFYLHSKQTGGGTFAAFLQLTSTNYTYYGDGHDVTPGQWEHFRWQVKVAYESEGNANGYIHGWVDDVQKWNVNNIHTFDKLTEPCNELNLNSTVNSPGAVYGENQKRWWDNFKIRVDRA